MLCPITLCRTILPDTPIRKQNSFAMSFLFNQTEKTEYRETLTRTPFVKYIIGYPIVDGDVGAAQLPEERVAWTSCRHPLLLRFFTELGFI